MHPFLLELVYFVKYCYFTKALHGSHTWNENINMGMINALITKPVTLNDIYREEGVCEISSIEHFIHKKLCLSFCPLVNHVKCPWERFGCPGHEI